MIRLTGVSKRYGAERCALRDVSLHVAPGEMVLLTGPSGAGKTTLLQVLACALPPTSGTLAVDGADPWRMPRRDLQRLRARLFLAPQVPPLPPRQRVVTAVLAGRLPAMGLLSSLRSLFYPADIPAAYEALERFDLANKLFDRVDRLSGGERQRVGLARALLAPARLWLVDEPLSALDPTRAQQALATLVEGARERAVTLVTTMHQVDEALEYFPRIVGLRDGTVAFDLATADVTRADLERLYAQHEDELRGEAPVPAAQPEPAPPVVMQCR
jgi:phosphonate transport system ATP-binding protein